MSLVALGLAFALGLVAGATAAFIAFADAISRHAVIGRHRAEPEPCSDFDEVPR